MDSASFLDLRQAFHDAESALAATVTRLRREGKPLDGDVALEYRIEQYQLAHDAYYHA